MRQVLSGHVRARGPYVVSRQRLDEIAAGPVEYRTSSVIDAAARLGFRVADERYQPSFGSHARNDMHVVRKNGQFMDVYLPSGGCFVNRGSHNLSVSASDQPLL